jgi:hypothetical protein
MRAAFTDSLSARPFVARTSRTALLVVTCLVTGIAGLACGGVSSPSTNTTDTFSSTLEVSPGNGNVHPFSTNSNGEFDLRLIALSPDSTGSIGVLIGQVVQSQCVLLSGFNNSAAILNRSVLSGTLQRGSYCVFAYDNGTLRRAQNYTLTLSHP